MAHYAFLNENNVVTEVITGKDETVSLEGLTTEQWYGNYRNQKCVRTSYNAATNGFRKNYASIGYTYDETRDAFIPPQPYPSWTLDETTCNWFAPVEMPLDKPHKWNESTLSWDEIVL